MYTYIYICIQIHVSIRTMNPNNIGEMLTNKREELGRTQLGLYRLFDVNLMGVFIRSGPMNKGITL